MQISFECEWCYFQMGKPFLDTKCQIITYIQVWGTVHVLWNIPYPHNFNKEWPTNALNYKEETHYLEVLQRKISGKMQIGANLVYIGEVAGILLLFHKQLYTVVLILILMEVSQYKHVQSPQWSQKVCIALTVRIKVYIFKVNQISLLLGLALFNKCVCLDYWFWCQHGTM